MNIQSKDLVICLNNFRKSMELIVRRVPPFEGMLYESICWVMPESKRILDIVKNTDELSQEVFDDIYESLDMFDGFYEACEVSRSQLGIPQDVKIIPLPLLRKVLTNGITELDEREISMKETAGYAQFNWEA